MWNESFVSAPQLKRDPLGSVFRSIVILVIDALLALPRLSFMLAVYFWMRVLGAEDPALARRRAVRWTWITLVCGAVVVVLWIVMANLAQW